MYVLIITVFVLVISLTQLSLAMNYAITLIAMHDVPLVKLRSCPNALLLRAAGVSWAVITGLCFDYVWQRSSVEEEAAKAFVSGIAFLIILAIHLAVAARLFRSGIQKY